MYLIVFVVASFFWDHTSALGDGFALLDKKMVNEQLNLRVPLMHETTGVRSVIQGMKDIQQRLERDHLDRRGIYDSKSSRTAQMQTQSLQSQARFSSESIPQELKNEQYIQVNEGIAPSKAYGEQISTLRRNPSFLNRQNQFLNSNNGWRNSFSRQQIYQNNQPTSFNQYQKYFENRQSLSPQRFSDDKQNQMFSQIASINQKQTLSPQRSSNARQQLKFPLESSARQHFGITEESHKNVQESIIPQQFGISKQLYIAQMLNGRKQQAVLPRQFYETHSQSFLQQPYSDKEAIEIKDRSRYQFSNQKGQIFDNTHSAQAQLLKSTERNAQSLAFENKEGGLLSSGDVSGRALSLQNSGSKDAALVATAMQNLGTSSVANYNNRASVSQHMKTPYVDYNYNHRL